ncbi:unnamed protein product [Somion occarium]|uniref:CCHC-type domain-containing protein n=1 Tax=Somion occarium TaxID=3059160 RepID=A0ABP1CZ58_9APHY
MVLAEQEVIDLTGDNSPSPNVIPVPSDDDEIQILPGPPSASNSNNKRSLEGRLTNGGPSSNTRYNTRSRSKQLETNGNTNSTVAESNANGKKRRKKKKKTSVVTPPEEGEIEEGEEDKPQSSSITTGTTKNDTQEDSRNGESSHTASSKDSTCKPMRNGQSLLDRLRGSDGPSTPVNGGTATPSKSSIKKRKRTKENDNAPTPSSNRRRSLSPEASSSLFFIDDTPAEVPAAAKPPPPPSTSGMNSMSAVASGSGSGKAADKGKEKEAAPLLLPAHVSVVFGETGAIPVEILPPDDEDLEDDSGIEYVDYDDNRKGPGVIRYFEDSAEAAADATPVKPKTIVCKHCGAEGDHKTFECRVLICLTCGVRDEHPTRSCPISKTCFTCGMKGHTRNKCPVGYSNGVISRYDECDRCGSDLHSTKECPTLWRLYEYVDEAQQLEVLRIREEKSDLRIGEGGEGYIATDEWCYNCGGSGHLGDDCREPHAHDFPKEPSAFSAYNTRSGPFFDPTRAEKPTSSSSRKARRAKASRDWLREDGTWADGYGFAAPMDVGKQGKRKERARMEQRAQEVQLDDDEDWFARRGRGSSGNARNGGGGGGGKGTPSSGRDRNSKKIAFGDLGHPIAMVGGGMLISLYLHARQITFRFGELLPEDRGIGTERILVVGEDGRTIVTMMCVITMMTVVLDSTTRGRSIEEDTRDEA